MCTLLHYTAAYINTGHTNTALVKVILKPGRTTGYLEVAFMRVAAVCHRADPRSKILYTSSLLLTTTSSSPEIITDPYLLLLRSQSHAQTSSPVLTRKSAVRRRDAVGPQSFSFRSTGYGQVSCLRLLCDGQD